MPSKHKGPSLIPGTKKDVQSSVLRLIAMVSRGQVSTPKLRYKVSLEFGNRALTTLALSSISSDRPCPYCIPTARGVTESWKLVFILCKSVVGRSITIVCSVWILYVGFHFLSPFFHSVLSIMQQKMFKIYLKIYLYFHIRKSTLTQQRAIWSFSIVCFVFTAV